MLDIVLLVLILLAAVSGWVRGLLASALGTVGFLVGFLLGLRLAPLVLTTAGLQDAGAPVRVGVQVLVVVVGASVLAWIGETLARRFLRAVDLAPVRLVDSAAGAVVVAIVSALVLWLAATAVRPVLPAPWADTLDRSRVLAVIDAVAPEAARDLPGRFRSTLQASGFPEVFSDLAAEPVIDASPPTGEGTDTDAVRRAGDSVLKIRSTSPRCELMSVGSGWTVAPNRVVTNAHVVAGGTDVNVQVGGQGRRLAAEVVAYDPALDLAVLAVPSLGAEPLARTGELAPGTEAVVAGFPGGGSYTLTPARVAAPIRAVGLDVYSEQPAHREVYPLRAAVRQGDSGGPLLTAEGRVAGTVFAKSVDNADTGYALTDAATARWLEQAPALTQPVPTGGCLSR